MQDSGYLARARQVMSTSDDLETAFSMPLDVIDAAPTRMGRVFDPAVNLEIDRRSRIRQQNRLRWTELLRATADQDPFSAALWVSFNCANSLNAAARAPEALLQSLVVQKDAPIVVYEASTCYVQAHDVLAPLAEREPRFREADFWLGFFELSRMQLDEAQAKLTHAYDWHPDWPAASVALAGLFMTAEEIASALDFYDRALRLLPTLADALVGRVRALSNLQRYEEALAGTDAFVNELPSDGYYWRAWNENQLERLDQAWADVESAGRYGVTAEIAKLAGVIAYRRHELDVARDRFATARRLDANDCDSHFYLGGVQAELKAWAPSAEAYVVASSCLEGLRRRLVNEITAIQTSDRAPDRKARQVASREQRIALADRMQRQAWFNLAANYFNVGRTSDARAFAEKVLDDEIFGERARSLLAQLPSP